MFYLDKEGALYKSGRYYEQRPTNKAQPTRKPEAHDNLSSIFFFFFLRSLKRNALLRGVVVSSPSEARGKPGKVGIHAVMVGKGEAAAQRMEEEHEEEGEMSGVVKLISAEGFEFVIDKKAAMVSKTLRNMLTSPGTLPIPWSIRFIHRLALLIDRIGSIPIGIAD
jgi:hypothetical protein